MDPNDGDDLTATFNRSEFGLESEADLFFRMMMKK